MIEILPYQSFGAIHFGATQEQVTSFLGKPKSLEKDRRGDLLLRFDALNVTIAPEGVVEFGILPDLAVQVGGIEIFSDPESFVRLCRVDGNPQESFGFIILLNLGITMTGFHDGEEGQKAVTAFAKGRWDILKPEMKRLIPKR